MTKALKHSPLTKIELKLWGKLVYLINEVDILKWVLGAFGTCIAFATNTFWNFLRRRNTDLDNVKKEVYKLGIKINRIDEDLGSIKRHSQRQSEEEMRILRKIDSKLPNIWEEVGRIDE